MADSTPSRLIRWGALLLAFLSAALWLLVTACFIGRWDQVAAVTTFPQWSWAIVGMLLTAIGLRLLKLQRKRVMLLLMPWVLTTLWFADNLVPVFRGLSHGAKPSSRTAPQCLRIITLNCASSAAAANEVMQFDPDIVLLQEIPPSNELARLQREWFGGTNSFVVGLDCAIVSRLPLTFIDDRAPVHYTQATLVLPGNREVLVTSLHLTPPVGRTDLWNPATWRAYAEDRRLRRRQLQAVLDARPARDLPEIIGGDFNAPAGDAIYRLLRSHRDAHRVAGHGWGGTAINTTPLFRPDQVWSKGLPVVSCYAVATVNSDHRMVVTDVLASE